MRAPVFTRVVWLAVLATLSCAPWAHAQELRFDLLSSVRTALARNSSVLVSVRQIEIAQAQLLEASGQFDTTLSTQFQKKQNYSVSTGQQLFTGTPATTLTDEVSSTVKATQLLRNGFRIEPALTIGRVTDNLALPGTLAPNRATIGLTITLPLMKNAGVDVVGANEIAAQKEVEAVRLDQAQTMAQVTLNVVSAYWQYLAAEKQRLIAADAEIGTMHRAQDTARLVQDEMLPASERDLVIADESAKRAARIAAEQTLVETRGTLARLLGFSADEARVLPLPTEAFPEVAMGGDVTQRLGPIRAQALAQRADLRAIEIRSDQAQVLMTALRKNLKPQLDLTFGLGFSGLKEGNSMTNYLAASGVNLRGPNAAFTLIFQFPLQNRSAIGQLAQKQGVLDQIEIGHHDLQNAILTSVDTLASSVQRLGLQLADAGRSVQLYAKSVENEETRRKLGRGTLIDVLNIADRLLQARQSLNSVQLNYMVAIAQLRYASGSLLNINGSNLSLDSLNLTTVP